MSVVMKVSKPGKNADSSTSSDILFDSQTSNHPVLFVDDYLVNSNPYTFSHTVGFAPKVWVNIVNAFNSTNDGRLPIEDSSIPDYDYAITRYVVEISRGAATNKTMRVIAFAKALYTV